MPITVVSCPACALLSIGQVCGLWRTELRTLPNSGNAVFTLKGRSAAQHVELIATALRECLAVDLAVIVKTAQEVEAGVTACPAGKRSLSFAVRSRGKGR